MKTPILSRILAVVGALTLVALAPVSAQTTAARGVAAVVHTAGVQQQLASTTLPTYGGVNSASLDAAGLPGVLSASALNTITTGMLDTRTTTAQTSSELGAVQLLDGLITADQVLAVASSYVNERGAASDATGSMLLGLVVAGQSFGTTPAPNTRITLPGTGYVILNEQTVTGNGATASGITVNMIHVVLTTLLGTKTGEIILGSATSSVSR
ncbi:MAG TPA: choice-of-anchor P family protein [Gemmatimonadales bacterium]|jgi:hypothetical protein|nr:choice-of-anchor P family protein [Gemmatimonadales bacterium]